MPLYEYQCPKCGNFEVIRKFSDEALTACPTCGQGIQKLVSASAFHLKGSGWYVTDYARKGTGAGAPKAEGGEPAKGGSEAKPGGEAKGGSESKPGSEAKAGGESASTTDGKADSKAKSSPPSTPSSK